MTQTVAKDDTAANNLAGIVAMVGAMAFFIFSDIFSKLSTERLPTGQVIALRGLFSFLIFIVPAIALGYLVYLRDRMSWPWFIRVLGEMGAALTFIPALANMPIANLTAIIQTLPLAMTAAGALILGEQVGIRRWAATAIGFLGAIIIMQPGTANFNWWSIAGLACVASIVVRDIATRKLDKSIPAILTTATTAGGVAIAGCFLGLAEGPWPMPDPLTWAYLVAAAIAVACGYYCSIIAVQRAPLSVVAPFRYTIVPMSVLAGYVVWSELPSFTTIFGVTIIIAAGLYTFLRERVRKAQSPASGVNRN